MGQFQYRCNSCSARVSQVEGNEYQCQHCGKLYTLLKAPDETPVGFVAKRNEPLFLPKGSVRALVTLCLTGLFIYEMHEQGMAGTHLVQLLLTCIFYYFGFRKRDRNIIVGGRIIQSDIEEPLYLPQGFIRNTILAGIVFSLFLVRSRIMHLDPDLLYFYFIFGALYAGYVFSKIIIRARDSKSVEMVNHFKAVIVLIATLVMIIHYMLDIHAVNLLVPYILISFYFGSRN
ncbi:hypothetical protein JW948_11760 [bacterium]|nr:hypothetical protein [bacterium]